MDDRLHLGDFTSNARTGKAVPAYYGDALVALGRERSNVVALTGDLAPATECDGFRDAFPDRFLTAGIAEANMIGMAAGMARAGDVPFAHTFSVFMSRRAYDQVAMQIAYPGTNVKLAGFLPGLTTLLGVSHQAIEDVALFRALPNMTIIEPCGGRQIPAAVRAAAALEGPVDLRMHRPAAVDERAEMPLEIGKGQMLRDGTDAIIFASGHMVDESLAAAADLSTHGTAEVAVANIHTIKPLDRDFIVAEARRRGVVIAAENHSIIGGLGSAVAETLMEAGVSARFRRIGVRDTFAEGGSTPYLFEKYELSSRHISAAVIDALHQNRKLS